MGILDAIRTPFTGARLLAEVRALRRAADRIADALELQVGQAPRSGQSFRGFSREKTPSDGQGSSVSYVDAKTLDQMLHQEARLRELLGRDPTDAELERAFREEIE